MRNHAETAGPIWHLNFPTDPLHLTPLSQEQLDSSRLMLSRSVSSNPLKSRSATLLSTSSQRRMFALHPPRRAERLPTFHHQRSLPKLPVPPLRASLDRYLKSLEPILEQNEEKGGEAKDAALKARQDWAQEFESGIGKALQQRLIGAN